MGVYKYFFIMSNFQHMNAGLKERRQKGLLDFIIWLKGTIKFDDELFTVAIPRHAS